MKKTAFVIYYHRQNFYSLNAIAGALETDKIFESIDFYFSSSKDNLLEIIKDLVDSYDKILVGISFFTSQLFETHDLVQKIKNKYKKRCLLVAGGSHSTGDPFGTLKMGFDIVVVGEGEETIVDLIQKIVTNEELSEVKGIAYNNRENENVLTNKRELIDLNNDKKFQKYNEKYGNDIVDNLKKAGLSNKIIKQIT